MNRGMARWEWVLLFALALLVILAAQVWPTA